MVESGWPGLGNQDWAVGSGRSGLGSRVFGGQVWAVRSGWSCPTLLDESFSVFSPDGCYLAAGSADGAVYIWNVSTDSLETRLPDKHR